MKKLLVSLMILALLLSACSAKPPAAADSDEPAAEATLAPADEDSDPEPGNNTASSDDLSSALNLVLGTTEQPGVFDSYHIEIVLNTPQANEDDSAVVVPELKISADVAGEDVHIFQVDPGMTEAKEGYILTSQDAEYKLVDGALEPMMGQIALGWAMWPLQVVAPYATVSSLYADKVGSEEINGRPAFVYELATSKAKPATLAGMQAIGVNTTGRGTVWIDKETGAMLKLDLEYVDEIHNSDYSKVIGEGTGHIYIEISKIGEVTVTSPL